jgi:uncharacterized protein (DUF2062 family)
LIRHSFKKFWQVVLKALQQGMSPQKLAITCALGAIISVFPVYGLTTLLCLGFATLFRLNLVVMLAVNYLLTPLQLLLLFPFLQGGIMLFGLTTVLIDIDELLLQFQSDFLVAMKEFSSIMLGGIAIWVIVAIPLFFLLYYAFYWLILRFKIKNMEKAESAE